MTSSSSRMKSRVASGRFKVSRASAMFIPSKSSWGSMVMASGLLDLVALVEHGRLPAQNLRFHPSNALLQAVERREQIRIRNLGSGSRRKFSLGRFIASALGREQVTIARPEHPDPRRERGWVFPAHPQQAVPDGQEAAFLKGA